MTNKKRGFTLLELMMVVAIIGVLVGTAMIAANKRHEKNEFMRMKTQIPEFFRAIAEKSFEEGKGYDIQISLPSKIEVYDTSTSPAGILDTLKLSEILVYEKSTSDSAFNTTEKGNLNKGFTIYIFNKDEEPLYRIAMYTTRPFVDYLQVNTYKPKDTANKDNYEDSDKWIKE
jgi:prepilin-type N-terminal cleavage/methylation domain-containing protein